MTRILADGIHARSNTGNIEMRTESVGNRRTFRKRDSDREQGTGNIEDIDSDGEQEDSDREDIQKKGKWQCQKSVYQERDVTSTSIFL